MATISNCRMRTSVPAAGMSAAVSMSATRFLGSVAHTVVLSTYSPFIDARNDAQGGASAWSPPV